MKLHPAKVEKLVNEHYENLYRFALGLSRNEAEAADLTQQAFYRLSTKGGQIRDLRKAKSWLYTTLRHEFFAMRKRSGRFIAIDESEEAAATDEFFDTEAVRHADAGIVMNEMGRIREVFREPLLLFYLEDLSYLEIADILDVPVGTVMSRLSRGKKELRASLADSPMIKLLPGNVVSINEVAAGKNQKSDDRQGEIQ